MAVLHAYFQWTGLLVWSLVLFGSGVTAVIGAHECRAGDRSCRGGGQVSSARKVTAAGFAVIYDGPTAGLRLSATTATPKASIPLEHVRKPA
jgi:hypothetical protein